MFSDQTHFTVDKQRIPGPDQAVFRSLEALLEAPGEQVTADSVSGVRRLSLDKTYYLKVFTGRGNWWRFMLRKDRFSLEKRNLAYFASLGLATPPLVAHGHRSRSGILRDAVLVTEEVAGALDLQRYIAEGLLYREGVAGARSLLGQLADATRMLHRAGFYAVDLKPRNILVREGAGQPELVFFDCPRGHHPPGILFEHSRVKDLAHLHRDLQQGVRAVDLMWAYRRYLDCESLDPAGKALARKVLGYYANRRMTKKRRRRMERSQRSR